MKLLTLLMMVFAFTFAYSTICGVAREFEHDLDSKVEKPEKERTQDTETPATECNGMHSMIATAYCLSGTTATGTQTRQGIAASKREWFGKTAKVYANNNGTVGELIGTYVIEDTGGTPIRNGSVIDLWMATQDECLSFGRRLVYVEIE